MIPRNDVPGRMFRDLDRGSVNLLSVDMVNINRRSDTHSFMGASGFSIQHKGEYMKCPVCTDVDLAMSDRQGIEIDYCTKCRGVWLDRGELDKIIERSSAPVAQPQAAHRVDPRANERSYGGHSSDYYRKKKKGGLLGELFDF